MNRCSKLHMGLVLAAVVVAVLVVGKFDRDAQRMEQRQYCDMVALGKQDPDLGWPDFRNVFDAQCNEDGSVKEAK